MAAVAHAGEARRDVLSFGGIVVLTLGALDFGLEGSIIIPALPNLSAYYDTSLIAVGWLATAFLLASIVAVPVVGRLGDLFGKRRLLLASLGAFAAGSLICALAHSIEFAIAGRVVQGLGAATAPLTVALVRDTVPSHQLPRVIGAVMGSASVGGGIGFLLGGILTDIFSPAAIFWFLFVLALALMAAVGGLVKESPVRANVRPDPVGAVLLGAGLVALLLAISKGPSWHWTSAAVIGLLAGAASLLALFALVERHVRQPHVDLRLVVVRPFASVNLCAFTFGFAFFVAAYVVPQIAGSPEESGYGLGLTGTQIGLLLGPAAIAGLVASWLTGRTVERLGPRTLVAAGGVCGIAGNVALALAHGTVAELAIGGAVVGLGWGLIIPSLYTVVLRRASPDSSTVAVAIPAIFRNTAASIGVTAAFAIITAAGSAGDFSSESGYTWAFVTAALGACAVLLASATLPSRKTHASAVAAG
jgi:MFS family permease